MNSPPIAIATEVLPLIPPTSFSPAAPTAPIEPTASREVLQDERLSETQMERLQQQHGLTRGLAQSLERIKQSFALRIWIVDNSGSMQHTDGHRIVHVGNNWFNTAAAGTVRTIDCSRWEEIVDCVEHHVRLASLLRAPSSFRFLNDPGAHVGPQRFSVAMDDDDNAANYGTRPQQRSHNTNNGNNDDEIRSAVQLLRKVRPAGCTPLTDHILEIRGEVTRMAPALRRTGRRVSIIIATDGLPTDERGYCEESQRNDFVDSLRLLEGLPVWVVIRLCTDQEQVVTFYNSLDSILELSIDVLDDFAGEAAEVRAVNPWLNYCLPIHRLREMGYHDRLLDLIDERPLTGTEIRNLCSLILGHENMDGIPDPSLDAKGFVEHISRLLNKEKKQWNPVDWRMKPWIDTKNLRRALRGKRFDILLPFELKWQWLVLIVALLWAFCVWIVQ